MIERVTIKPTKRCGKGSVGVEQAKKWLNYGGSLILAGLVSYLTVEILMREVIARSARLERVLARFDFTDVLLIGAMTLALWLFYLQWLKRTLWPIYWYLAYSLYACLLFVMLFTKADTSHAVSLNPLDYLNWYPGVLEFLLNVVAFIPLGAWYGAHSRPWEFVIIALVTILGIETAQYVFYLGIFAISDILANFIGCTLGYLVHWRCRSYFIHAPF